LDSQLAENEEKACALDGIRKCGFFRKKLSFRWGQLKPVRGGFVNSGEGDSFYPANAQIKPPP
jgi:hypothetical protein